jgi:hypothetical protein
MRMADKASGLSLWGGRITLLYTLLRPESKVARRWAAAQAEPSDAAAKNAGGSKVYNDV